MVSVRAWKSTSGSITMTINHYWPYSRPLKPYKPRKSGHSLGQIHCIHTFSSPNLPPPPPPNHIAPQPTTYLHLPRQGRVRGSRRCPAASHLAASGLRVPRPWCLGSLGQFTQGHSGHSENSLGIPPGVPAMGILELQLGLTELVMVMLWLSWSIPMFNSQVAIRFNFI